jgi:pantoate--beta-alanine ligase
MGALHAGHLALVTEAKRLARHVVASIFVNPAQFGPGEDFASYPRTEKEDAARLEAAGCAMLWAPDAATMYPDGLRTMVRAGPLAGSLCGAVRPGHFDGVLTVVAKLFHQVQPDIALFGEKDFQQLVLIRQMVRDLDFPLDAVGVPTLRDADGVALSSRNAYLSAGERRAARALPRMLGESARRLAAGEEAAAVLAEARERLLEAGFASVDYVELRAEDDLAPLAALDRPARLLAAARIGKARLIDNLAVAPDATSSPTR